MMKMVSPVTVLICGLLGGSALASPPIPNPDPPDMDVEISAKIMKEKSKTTTLMGNAVKSGVPDVNSGGNCSININSNNAPKSNSGIKEMFGKQTTTIVTGPVINTANCK